MQFALLVHESRAALEIRHKDGDDPYLAAWRAYYKDLVEAGVYVGGEPLGVPDTARTVRRNHERERVQDGPYADTKEQLGGFIILELPSLDTALEWAARCPAAADGAIEVRPVAHEFKRRVTG